MGRFSEAINSFKKANEIQFSDEVIFDIKVFEFLNLLVSEVVLKL